MDYEEFKSQILSLTKIDLNAYKERQMKRRIDSLIARHSYKDYKEYVNAIKTDTSMFEEFVNYLTINVSEFWRNPEQWKILERDIIPELLKRSAKLKIWSAACSTGDEPYSLVMLLSKFMPLKNIEIIATDIDKQVLEKAQTGLYNQKSLAGLPKEFVDKYFDKIGLSNYQIHDEIKKCVKFSKGNLLEDKFDKGFDLIVCRNVVIYFTDEAKTDIYRRFHESLKPGGYLFVGSTEQIINYKALNYTCYHSFFYKKE